MDTAIERLLIKASQIGTDPRLIYDDAAYLWRFVFTDADGQEHSGSDDSPTAAVVKAMKHAG